MGERVVLACSGGLDTTAAVRSIAEDAEVVAVAVDFGQGGEDLATLRHRALESGAVEAVVIDARDEFAERYCLPALQANALCADRSLVSALSHPLIVTHVVEAARAHDATTVAHGTDQTRFAAGIAALAPDLKVLPPIGGISIAFGGTSFPGWDDPAADELVITFDQGVPVAIDGETVTFRQAVQDLNRRQPSGRSRGIYAGPGAQALVTAHQALEDVTLERDLARFKRTVGLRWAELVHDGLWFSPLKDALDAFLAESQQHVSGEIRMVLHGGRAVVDDRRAA